MELFRIENYKALINKTDVYLVPEFKAMLELKYNTQKGDHQGRNRVRAYKEFTFLYFYIDYRSEYNNYTETEKKAEALLAANLPEDYSFSKELKAAIKKYKELQETRILKLLNAANNAIDKIRIYYDNLDFTSTDNQGKPRHDPSKVLISINGLAKTIESLEKLEKKVKQSLKQDTGVRGDSEEGFLS